MLSPEIWVNIFIYLLNKEEVWNIWKNFKDFQDEVENHCNKKIKSLDIWVTCLAKTPKTWGIVPWFVFPDKP